MEYVIACFVKNEGKVYYGDKPASAVIDNLNLGKENEEGE